MVYTPAGAVVMDSPAREDSIGVRIPIIAQWDTIAAQELSACQADWAQRTKTENPMVEKTLLYVQGMGSNSGAQPDRSQLIWPPLAAPALSPNNGRDPLPVGRAEARAPPRAAGRAAGRGRPARRMGRPLVRRSRRSRPARVANRHAGAELSVSRRPNYGAQPVSWRPASFCMGNVMLVG